MNSLRSSFRGWLICLMTNIQVLCQSFANTHCWATRGRKARLARCTILVWAFPLITNREFGGFALLRRKEITRTMQLLLLPSMEVWNGRRPKEATRLHRLETHGLLRSMIPALLLRAVPTQNRLRTLVGTGFKAAQAKVTFRWARAVRWTKPMDRHLPAADI